VLTEAHLQSGFAEWGLWVVQLLDTFPLLAYLVLHPGTEPLGADSLGREKWGSVRREILSSASRGAKLKELGKLAGLPWNSRRFRLPVAPIVLRDPEPYADRLVDTWLPESPAAQHTWVLALRFLHRDPSRRHVEQSMDFKVVEEWMARHAGTPEFDRHVLKRENPKRLTRRFWTPIRDWLTAQCDSEHPWHNPDLPRLNPRTTPAELVAAIEQWHAWVATRHIGNAGERAGGRSLRPQQRMFVVAPDALAERGLVPGMVFRDGWYILPLTQPRDLVNEGRELGHCVASYTPDVFHGIRMLYSLRDADNRPQITIELTTSQTATGFKIIQASGLRNRPPTRDEWRRLRSWERSLSRADGGRPVYFLEAPEDLEPPG